MALNPALVLLALPLLAAPSIYFLGRIADKWWPERIAAAVSGASVVALLAVWPFYLLTVRQVLGQGPVELAYGAVALRVDGLSLLLAGVALTLGVLVALYSGRHMAGKLGDEKYYASLVAMVGMIIGLGCANDLFNLWVWFEGMAIASYLLVVFYRDRPTALEAGVKYLVQSATGSVLVLMAIALVLAETGGLDLDGIPGQAMQPGVLLVAVALFTTGFGVKIALVPLHTWLPDAHAQAPSGISALLSGVVIEAGLVALLRVLMALSGTTSAEGTLAGGAVAWGLLLMLFGALNMVAGNLLALRQQQVKRLLAYSSLSHVGYMVLGLGIGIYAGQAAGMQGGLFHLVNHGMMKGLAFLAAGAFLYALAGAAATAGSDHSLTIADLGGAARRYPLAAFALSLAVLGLAGLPPLAGFASKWQIFVAGFATQSWWVSGLIVFAALNSVFSLAYYAPVVNAVYRQQPSAAVQQGRVLPFSMQLPLLLLAVAVFAAGVWPNLLAWLIEPAGAVVAAGFGV